MTTKASFRKRFLSLFLVFSIVMTMVPEFSILSYAENSESDDGWVKLSEMDPNSDEYYQLKNLLTSNNATSGRRMLRSANVNGNYMSNDYIAFNVVPNGRFTIGTTGGNPNNNNDDNKRMIYGHPGGNTSYTTLRVDGISYVYSANGTSFDSDNANNISSNTFSGINIEQKLSIINNPATDREDVVEIKYTITNVDEVEKPVGLRIMLDTMLGGNDAAPFRVPQYGSITMETEFVGEDIPQFWQAFDNLSNPSVIAQGRFYKSADNKPDRVQFTNWGRVYNNSWGYSVNPSYYNGDSAVSVIWDETVFQPNESREYVTYYGLSEFTEDLSLPLALSVYSDSSVDVVNNRYIPNPVDITAYVQNISNIVAEEVSLRLELPSGLELASGSNEIVEIGTMRSDEIRQAAWSVNVLPTPVDKDYQYKVILTAADGYQKVVSRVIHIPASKQEKALEYTIFSGSNKSDLNLYGWKSSFSGNVYTGKNFNYGGSEFYVVGKIDAVGNITTNGWKTEITERNDGVDVVEMPDFESVILDQAEPIEVFDESPTYIQDKNIINGSILVNGDVTVSGTTFEGDCYIIADGNITYNVNQFNTTGRVVLYSRNGNVTINGSTITVNGIIYAPKGSVTFNTYDTTLNGRIVADTINFSGSIFNIIGSENDWELIGGGTVVHNPEEVSISAEVPEYVTANVEKTIQINAISNSEELSYSAVFDNESISVDENGIFTILTPDVSGEYILMISASEPNGGSDTKSYTVIVDTEAPIVNVNADRDVVDIGDAPIIVTVSVVDDYGIDATKIFINGELYNEPSDTIEIATDDPKNYVIRVESYDFAGNVTVSEKEVEVINVITDTEPPVISAYFDKEVYYIGDDLAMNLVVEDNDSVSEVVVTFDGIEIIGERDTYNVFSLENGQHEIVITAVDASGNAASAAYRIVSDTVLDSTAPVVNILSIIPTEIHKGDSVLITVSAEDESGIANITASINGEHVDVVEGVITYIPDTEGEYTVTVNADDTYGNSSSTSALFDVLANVVTIDTNAPTMRFSINFGGEAAYVGNTITISVEAEDDSGTVYSGVKINGMELAVHNGIYEYIPNAAGQYSIIVYAYDPSGNRVEYEYIMTVYERNAPVTDVYPPIGSCSFNLTNALVGEEIIATIESEDESGTVFVDATVNGEPLEVTNNEIRFVPQSEGVYNFEIKLSDAAGNASYLRQNVTVTTEDVTAPSLKVSGIPDIAFVGQNIEFTIIASDASGTVNLSAFVNEIEIGIEDNKASFTPREVGEINVTVVATDISGNERNYHKTIVVRERTSDDINAPELDIVSFPAQGTVGEEMKIEYTASDDSGEVFIKVTVNDEEIDADENCAIFVPSETGRYDIVITASDAAGNIRTASGSVVVTSAVINDDTLPTMSITGINQIITLGETLIISITAEDDSGNVTVTASINDSPVEIVDGKLEFTPSETGIYTLVIRAEDAAENYVQKLVEILVKEPVEYVDGKPVVNIYINDGSGVSAVGEALDIRVTADDPDGISSIKVTINGEEKELDEEGKLSFISEETGRYVVTVEAIDSLGNAITETVKQMVVDPEDNSYCEVKITSPSDGGVVTSLTDIKGTVSGDGLVYYSLSYCPAGEEEYIEFASGEETVSNGILGKFDPTLLENGYYNIRLTAYSSLYNVSDEVVVSVEGQMKIGNYSIAFQDMDISVAGYPLTVIRSYDSRRKSSDGDFGYGWDMALSSIKLSESCIPGSNWYHEASASMFATMYSFAERKVHEISIDYGNGKTEKFRMKLSPNQPNMYKITTGISVSYEATDGSKSKLEPIGTRTNLVYNGNLLCYSSDLTVYNPSKYKLTRADGTVYIISDTNGVESITDTNGNTITITNEGVTHSDGKSIVFDRDSDGRIIKITGPSGKAISYEYDSNGNLSYVTDEAGEKTSFTYDRYHYLTDITDSRGVKVARNEYDDDGRLVATVDANGNRLEFSHDIDGKRDIVTDRLGNSTLYVYDNRGNVISETDALGNTTLSTYDSKGNLKTKTDALGNVTTYNYDSQGNLLSVTNALGNTVTNTYSDKGQLLTISSMGVTQFIVDYDERGNLTSTEDAMGNKISYEYESGKVTSISDGIGTYMNMTYDGNGNVVSAVNGAGETASFTYDTDGNCASKTITRRTASGTETLTEKYSYDVYGNLTKIIYADGSVTNVEYDSVGNMTAAVDEKGRRTEYEYDIFGNLVKIKYCDNTTETFEYDVEGRNTKATDRMGRSVTMTYDAVGNLISKTYPNGSKVTYNYDAKYRLVSVKGANGGTTKYEYDALDRNTAIVDALDNRTEFDYNSASGLLETMTDPMGNTYTYGYDLNGNRTSVTMPDGTSISTAYDARGRITSQTDQHDNTTRYTYDGADRLTSVTDALGGKWKYSYNSVGELVTITDANGNTTKYEYDNGGRVIKTTNAAGDIATVTYDETDNVLTSTDYAGNVTTFTYDELDRVISKTVSGDTVTYSYRADGLLSSVTDRNGVTSYTYDIMNGLTSVTLYDGKTINYTYDDACRLTSVKTPFGTTKYSYDLMDRLVKVVANDGTATLYEYDANGNRTAVRYANGMIVKYEYDTVNRLVLEKVLDKDANVVVQYVYTLGAAGERTKVVETGADPASERTVEYAYDALYRLTSETVTDANGVSVTEYTYDSNSNRLTKTVDGEVTEYSYNELNQLVSETGIRYKYDKNGNLVKKTEGEQITTYTYDARNKLIRATVQSGQQVSVEEYAYDFAGNRIAKIGEISTTYYLVDTNGALSQVLAEYDENGTLTTNYTRADELISQERSGAKWYYLYDGSDSVRMLANEDGEITDTYTFDAFGNLTASTGSTKNVFLYRGEQYDSFTGLYYLRARYMNPATGTFITMDEYSGSVFEPVSLHKYLYANANPVMNSDPTGYFTLMETTVANAISDTLNKAYTANMSGLLNGMLNALIASLSGCTQEEVQNAFTRGFFDGFMMGGGYAALAQLAGCIPLFKLLVSAFDIWSAAGDLKAGIDAYGEGDILLGTFFVVSSIAGFFSAVKTAGQACFTGDTLVATEDGQIRIDELQVGDKVWAYNVETGETELKTVLKVYVHSVDEILHLYTDEGDIDTTTNHPFYVIGQGWTAAGDLVKGDEVYNLDGTTSVVLDSEIEKLDECVLVYNLEVEDYHSYFVGNVSVLVHNYVASSGNVYPENIDYSYIDPNSSDYLYIHNNHPHAGIMPHTHFPISNVAPNGTIYLNAGGYSPTKYSDYELLDYAINVLGWIKNPKGGR